MTASEVMDDSKGDNWWNTTLRLKKTGKEILDPGGDPERRPLAYDRGT